MTDRALTDEDVDAIARRVVQLMPRAGVPHLLDAVGVAEMVSMSLDWVREHAAELGGVRVGAGSRGELRFEADKVRAYLAKRRLKIDEPKGGKRPGPKPSASSDVELIDLPRWAA
jgi:hypothetical protein